MLTLPFDTPPHTASFFQIVESSSPKFRFTPLPVGRRIFSRSATPLFETLLTAPLLFRRRVFGLTFPHGDSVFLYKCSFSGSSPPDYPYPSFPASHPQKKTTTQQTKCFFFCLLLFFANPTPPHPCIKKTDPKVLPIFSTQILEDPLRGQCALHFKAGKVLSAVLISRDDSIFFW